MMPDSRSVPLVVGVSSCLLGHEVRFDGGHKRDNFVVETLAPHVRFVAVCPEVELGLGTPRETLRLIRRRDDLRMVMKTGVDYTDDMRRFSARRVAELAGDDLDGFVLKKDSPSCGWTRVKVYDEHGAPAGDGRGLFAAALADRFPSMPIEDEGRLCDARLRENFIERLFAYRRLQSLFSTRWTQGDLVAFHTAHKFALLAHDEPRYRRLGRLVADGRILDRATLRNRYTTLFMETLTRLATPRTHTNVLQHVVGHFRGQLDPASRDDVLACIDGYRLGHVPLVVPLTLVRHHVRRLGVPYLEGQIYLNPHPKELALRHHV